MWAITYNPSREESSEETPGDLPSVSWDTLRLLKGLHKAYLWGWLGQAISRGYQGLSRVNLNKKKNYIRPMQLTTYSDS